MQQYEEQLLRQLLEKYRKSKKDLGKNIINRRTQLAPGSLYKKYNDNDADLAKVEAVNEAIKAAAQKGWVQYDGDAMSDEVSKVYLADAYVGEIENYLVAAYGYKSREQSLAELKRLLANYDGRTPALTAECRKLQNCLEKRKPPRDLHKLEDIFKALLFVEQNTQKLYLREASMLIYGSSKYFEENTLSSVASALRQSYDKPCPDEELNDEILQKFSIYKEQQRLCVKGKIIFTIAGKNVDIGAFANGIDFAAEDLANLEKVTLHAKSLMTVENKTSYQRLADADTAYFYLGGFMSRGQRDFLKQVFRDNPTANYWHFGDIDAGGLFIYEHLCRETGIPFAMYRMSVSELQDAKNRACLLPLTAHDRERLAALRQKENFCAIAEYMLEHNVKLEQEIISLHQFQ